MAKLSFICFIFCMTLAPVYLTAQIESSTTIGNEAGLNARPSFKNAVFNGGSTPNAGDNLMYRGSIGGRISNESQTGIYGVRVLVRSAGVIVGYTLSDATGVYEFQELAPGKYTVEIDPVSVPAKFQATEPNAAEINVEPAHRSSLDLSIRAQRNVSGVVFIDKDNDGQFKPGRDEPVKGAIVAVNGSLTVSGGDGRYVLKDLPAGRVGLLVTWPQASENTHIVLDLPTGPVSNRIVNVSRNR